MNWARWRRIPWIDSRAKFVADTPKGGALLDLGTSDGSTLCHFAELRPDIRFAAVDLNAARKLPPETRFFQANLESDRLDWTDASFDAITCMHLVEHLSSTTHLWGEIARLLRPGGRVYVETPGPMSLTTASASTRAGAAGVTLNFYDDRTHTALVPIERMNREAAAAGLVPVKSGPARNWLFAAAYPAFRLIPPRRNRYVSWLHWAGWADYIVATKRGSD
jgi:2-polyprenyl-3-methyl-5-hydroxy-6-metoxy-1,4-benzoquinol methylase